MNSIINSLNLINNFFLECNVQYWLEAGTALAAYRDGKIFAWDHDIDVAIWRDEMPDPEYIKEYFQKKGFKVVIQKDFPYIDNIIQLYIENNSKDNYIDIDIYLYSKIDGSAVMRWIHSPVGKFNIIKKKIIYILRNLTNPRNKYWKNISVLIPGNIPEIIFKL